MSQSRQRPTTSDPDLALPASLTGRLGAVVGRHARAVLTAWVLAILACFALSLGLVGPGLFGSLGQEEPYVPGEAHVATQRLTSASSTGPSVLVRVDGLPVRTQAGADRGEQLAAALAKGDRVHDVQSAFAAKGGLQDPRALPYLSTTAPDSTVLVARLDPDLSKGDQEKAAEAVHAAADAWRSSSAPSTTVSSGGAVSMVNAITTQVEHDLRTGEGIALPATLLVMVLVFGGFAAAGIPIVGAIASIAGGLAALLGFSFVMDLDATVVNIVTILGLGLSIDYGLLIVSRYREELARLAPDLAHHELDDAHLVAATAHTVGTAGRTVLFSGLTVAISVAGMLVFPAPVIRAVGIAGVSVVAVAVLAALTLVPALCRVAGRRLVAKRVHDSSDEGLFARLARFVQRHVWATIFGCVAFLLVLALPVLSMHQVSSSTALLPKGHTERVFLEGVTEDFPFMGEPTATVVAKATPTEVGQWAQKVYFMPFVTSVDPPRPLGDGYTALGVRASSAASGNDVGEQVVTHLRENRPGFDTWVTGQDAKLIDYNAAIMDRAPWAVALVVLATVVLLFLMTGSIALPLKALVFNVLSLGASLGVIVFIFQEGHLESLLGFTSTGGVESVVPVILLAFAFGLSMDYEVFLLSRIVELHEGGASDAEAVAVGVQRSGKIVTSAALLILIVLLGFAAARMIIVKEIGIGLAISIAIDATIVRMLLVPATMTMLGRWNWWAPGPLRRWHERFGITEG